MKLQSSESAKEEQNKEGIYVVLDVVKDDKI